MYRKQGFKTPRVVIISLLFVCVMVAVLLLPHRGDYFTDLTVRKEIVEEFNNMRFTTDAHTLNAIQQEGVEDVKEPDRIIFKEEKNPNRFPDRGLSESHGAQGDQYLRKSDNHIKQNLSNLSFGSRRRVAPVSRKPTDEKVRLMRDQLVQAKAYLGFALPHNPQLAKELRLRMREVERVVGATNKDSNLPRSATKRMKAMNATLLKASAVYHDCAAMLTKLRAMAYNSEDEVRAQMQQTSYLTKLAAGTLSKGLHCLEMQLTADYFALDVNQREFANKQKLLLPHLIHYAVFSDNVLACAVVVNSTISTSKNPEKVVFHLVTDALNYPSMMMWFLANPPGKGTIEILSIDDLNWLPARAHLLLQHFEAEYSNSLISRKGNPRYTSPLNHLRFLLADLFPKLDRIILLDEDVVVQRDLTSLWKFNMHGKIIGVVETCGDSESPYHLDRFLNFSDPVVASSFDVNACSWAFGMNVFDLREWRRWNLTALYQKWQELGQRRQLWKLGTLPVGMVTFYNTTAVLDKNWHVLGLGYDTSKTREEIERAAVIHYDGNLKPWLEIGIPKFKGYWSKFLKYDNPYLQQCNIHE